MSQEIIFEKINGIGKITLNRPKAYNSFTREMAVAMQEALKECETNDDIRCVYIIGNGKAFSAGQDLVEITDPDRNRGFEKIVSEHYNPIIMSIYNLPKPVVAAVNGVAAGAGANIALICDIIVASESASFIQAFSKIGLIPDSGGTYVLPRLIGFQKALAITMLGDKISATEAERLNMIYKYYSDEEFENASWAIAEKLAGMPTKGLAYTKKAYNLGLNNSLQDQLANECQYQCKASETDDYTEGVNAFLEKRKPIFKGK